MKSSPSANGYRAGLKLLQVWIEPEQKKSLKIFAAQEDSTVADVVRAAIADKLASRSKEE